MSNKPKRIQQKGVVPMITDSGSLKCDYCGQFVCKERKGVTIELVRKEYGQPSPGFDDTLDVTCEKCAFEIKHMKDKGQ